MTIFNSPEFGGFRYFTQDVINWYIETFKYHKLQDTYMDTATFSNIEQVIRRTIKSDGRCGGMQHFIGREVDIIIYDNEPTEEEYDTWSEPL